MACSEMNILTLDLRARTAVIAVLRAQSEGDTLLFAAARLTAQVELCVALSELSPSSCCCRSWYWTAPGIPCTRSSFQAGSTSCIQAVSGMAG